jgi:hypothetical protein
MRYKSAKELERKTLKHVDGILFNNYILTVQMDHISVCDYDNDTIFKELNLDKYKFCSEHYGYKTESGLWPSFTPRDYAAATRVIIALFNIIEHNVEPKVKIKYKTIFLRD